MARRLENIMDRDKMLEDQDLHKKLLIPAVISLFAGFARYAFSEKRSFWHFIRGALIAGFVGLMTSLAIQDVAMSEGIKGMIIGVTSFCADEVATFLVAAATEARRDPLGYVDRMVKAFRGEKK